MRQKKKEKRGDGKEGRRGKQIGGRKVNKDGKCLASKLSDHFKCSQYYTTKSAKFGGPAMTGPLQRNPHVPMMMALVSAQQTCCQCIWEALEVAYVICRPWLGVVAASLRANNGVPGGIIVELMHLNIWTVWYFTFHCFRVCTYTVEDILARCGKGVKHDPDHSWKVAMH